MIAAMKNITGKLLKADDFIRNKRTATTHNLIKLSALSEIDDKLFNDGGTQRPPR